MFIQFVSSLLKQLRKRLRKRRKLSLGFWVILILLGWMFLRPLMHSESSENLIVPVDATPQSEVLQRDEISQYVLGNEVTMQVELQIDYVCGEERQQLGNMKSQDILALMDEHPDWQAKWLSEDRILFYEYVEDLSDTCKEKAYIGIDAMDYLTLFDGMPEDDNVIRTFFQLNISHLRSSLPEDAIRQLYEGIRISDLAEYNSVLSTFSDYAVEQSRNVMKQE